MYLCIHGVLKKTKKMCCKFLCGSKEAVWKFCQLVVGVFGVPPEVGKK